MFSTLVFLFKERAELTGWRSKHLGPVTAAIKDAIPIVERYRQRVAPESAVVQRVETVLKAAVDPANPQPGDEFSPTNPNQHAG